MVADELGLILAGRTRGLDMGGDSIASPAADRPFVARLGEWGVKVASKDFETDLGTVLVSGTENFDPFVALDGSGGMLVGGNVSSQALVGFRYTAGVSPRSTSTAAGYLIRMSSDHYLDCR